MLIHAAPRAAVLAFFLFLSCLCNAEYTIKCSNSSVARKSHLTPSEDGVEGRYTLEWCTAITPNDTKWHVFLSYNGKHPSRCTPGTTKHSEFEDSLDIQNITCDFACLYTNLDLIFSSCYVIENWIPSFGSSRDINYQNISNSYTADTWVDYRYKFIPDNHGDYATATFFFGTFPVTKFEVRLCKEENRTVHDHEPACWDVSRNCSVLAAGDRRDVRCRCDALAGPGFYSLTLRHLVPWKAIHIMHHLVVITPPPFYIGFVSPAADAGGAGVEGGRGTRHALLWAGAGVAALGAGAGALYAALRCRLTADYRKRVVRTWRDRARKHAKEAGADGGTDGVTDGGTAGGTGAVVVLYARECARGQPVLDALLAMLETVYPGQVYDIYSPRTVSLAAPNSGEWLRGMLQSADVRVVVLQTPALQALHVPRRITDTDTDSPQPRLEQPLLSSHAVYRVPSPSDWLLQYALRVIADTSYRPDGVYRKFYLATLEGMETEALPYTVPFRRYLLPRHALTLLRDVAPPPATPPSPACPPPPPPPPAVSAHALDSLAAAVRDFVEYARARPDYLLHELLIVTD